MDFPYIYSYLSKLTRTDFDSSMSSSISFFIPIASLSFAEEDFN